MTPDAYHLLSEALKLPPEEREDLAARLMGSITGAKQSEQLDPDWDEEIAHRVEDLIAGRVKTIPAEEMHREMRERIGE
jgi:putative addiction module component (TIGR02574 family)